MPDHDPTESSDAGDEGGADAAGPPPAQIEHLLTDADGRLTQQEIVVRTEWSADPVAHRLTQMEDEGRIIRLRVGEKLIACLPDAVPNHDDHSAHDSSP